MKRFGGLVAVLLMVLGLVAAPPAWAALEIYSVAVQVRGQTPIGLAGFVVTTTCRATSPGPLIPQADAVTSFPVVGGSYLQAFDSALADCLVRTTMSPQSAGTTSLPTVQIFRENGVLLNTVPTANPGEFQSERFIRTSSTTLLVRWEFPSFQVNKVVDGIAELSPGFEYQLAAVCRNGADPVLTFGGNAELAFGLRKGAARTFSSTDFPTLRTTSVCTVSETNSGGFDPMFEIRPFLTVPTIKIGSQSPPFSPLATVVTAKNLTYGQLAISLAAESQPSNAQIRFSGTCKGILPVESQVPFSFLVFPGQTWRSDPLPAGMQCSLDPTPNPTGISVLRTLASGVTTSTYGDTIFIASQAGKGCPTSNSGVAHGMNIGCADVLFYVGVPDSYVPLAVPKRALDTRLSGTGPVIGGVARSISLRVPIAVPTSASVVIVNATVVNPSGAGFVTLYPCLEAVPNTANVTFAAGETAGSLAMVRLNEADEICAYSSVTTDLVIDVSGYTAERFLPPLRPSSRMYDSRANSVTVDGQGSGDGLRPAGSVTRIKIGGRGTYPTLGGLAILNIWAVSPEQRGFLTAYDCSQPRPNTANVNYEPNQTIGNLSFVTLTAVDQTICVFNQTATHLIVDAVGSTSSTFTGYLPSLRVMDTRADGQTMDGQFKNVGVRPAGTVTELTISGRPGFSQGIRTIALNVTAVDPQGSGWVTVYPCGQPVPLISSLNVSTSKNRGNFVLSRLSDNGTVCVYTSVATHLVVDVSATASV
jgi:Domain of unknown function (DUF5979)